MERDHSGSHQGKALFHAGGADAVSSVLSSSLQHAQRQPSAPWTGIYAILQSVETPICGVREAVAQKQYNT